MEKSRLEMLKELLERNPKDPFTRYGLAMEYVRDKKYEQAITQFEKLVDSDPDYTASYFHLGHAYETLGRLDDAKRIYKLGIEACERKRDEHAKKELQDSLDQLSGFSF